MISVADGDPPLPLPQAPSVSVSVSRSMSESGFVNIIRLVFIASFAMTREFAEEKLTDGRLFNATLDGSVLTTGRSCRGLGRVKKEGDSGGETKTVYRRPARIWTGGEGCGVGVGVKYESRSRSYP